MGADRIQDWRWLPFGASSVGQAARGNRLRHEDRPRTGTTPTLRQAPIGIREDHRPQLSLLRTERLREPEMGSRRSTTQIQAVQQKHECPLCGGDRVTTSLHRQTFSYGSGESAIELTVDVPVHRCGPCDFEYLDEVAEDLKHEAICQHFGVLSPGEIRRIREGHQMTRARFAEITGLGEASLNRWENGLTIQTQAYDKYLRLLVLPGIMQHLKDSVAGGPSLRSPWNAGEKRFRTLEVNDDKLKEQKHFRLRPAA